MKPTKQELINAGFEEVKYERLGFGPSSKIHVQLKIENITINYYSCNGHILVTDGYGTYETEAVTKEMLNKALFFWTKKDLDFTEKVKTYTYEDCEKDVAWATCSERLTFNSGKERNQAEAAAKLSFVVAKINEDYPHKSDEDNNYCYPRYLDCGNHPWKIESTDYIEEVKIAVRSRKGCEILLRDNEELLKQLYGID